MTVKTTRTFQLLARSELMTQVVALEPNVLVILERVATLPIPETWTRWTAYEYVKSSCDMYIGNNARTATLATPHHYQAFIAFIDALLPDSDAYYSEMEDEAIA